MFLLGSCTTTSHGYNYKAHKQRNERLTKKVNKMNKGRDLTHFKAPCKKKK